MKNKNVQRFMLFKTKKKTDTSKRKRCNKLFYTKPYAKKSFHLTTADEGSVPLVVRALTGPGRPPFF